jgi:ADP-ribose pyrophosphatase YjhB (NUDIX family)
MQTLFSEEVSMSPAQQMALWADKLRGLAAMGLRYAPDHYHQGRYQAIQEIAMAMLALATGDSLAEMERLRASIFSHITPFTTGDAAIIDEGGRILLIRRADNGLWAMPGGALEVGETPAAGVEREAFEESGLRCRAVSLVGVFDSRLCGTTSRHHLYQIVLLCQPLTQERVEPPPHPNEVLGVAWFTEDTLPANIDPGHIPRIPEAFRVWRGDVRPFFDMTEAK